MTQANRVQVAFCRETTAGTTPATPRMRKARLTGESMFYRPLYNQGEELRDDRMVDDPTQIMFESGGGTEGQFSYPKDETWWSELIRSTMYNTWTNSNQRDNDGTADSVITDVATTNTILTVTTGTAFVAKELYHFSGFTVANNNGVFACTTGSATVPRFVGSGITDEAVPPAAARVKCVGFIGDSGDINATATGLSSTSTNFTTIPGIAVGKWLKIGGTAGGMKFVTAALNDWVRITAVTATALTFDNRPTGWTTETGTGLTVKFWFGDQIKNGTTVTALTIERGFLGQTTPTYIVNTGMHVGQAEFSIQNRAKVSANMTFSGMGGSQSTTALDASPDAVSTNAVMSAHVNVGRLAEGGSAVVSPNFARSISFTINNNLEPIEDVTDDAPVGITDGECTVTGNLETYFGSNATLAKFFNGTVTSLNARIQKNSQAVVFQLPRVTLSGGGNPSASAKNTQVMAAFEFTASKDTDTSAHVLIDRLEYYE